MIKQKQHTKEALPKGIRQVIYSFLPLGTLIQTISKLSTTERQLLTTSQLIDQPKTLRIKFRDEYIYDINSLKYMMKLLKSKWPVQKHLSTRVTIRSYKPKIRSINSSSPVLEQNLLNVDLETNSDSPANQIFQNQLEQISDSNISRSQSIND